MKICCIASGSSGNSLYIESKGTAVIIDQGISHRELMRRLSIRGLDVTRVCGILVSHEHTDHTSGISVTARQLNVPIYTTAGSLERIQGKLQGDERIIPIEGGASFTIGSLEILPFSIPHDAADPVQFCVISGRKKIAIATDLGFVSTLVSERLKDSDLVVIEANYDADMLRKGPYSWELKQRIMGKKGHLSNANASQFIFNISRNGLPKVILAHLSEENNQPDIAEREVRELFEKFDKKLGPLIVALPNEPTDILQI